MSNYFDQFETVESDKKEKKSKKQDYFKQFETVETSSSPKEEEKIDTSIALPIDTDTGAQYNSEAFSQRTGVQPDPEAPSQLGAAAESFAQGATLGFSDEIEAGLRSTFGDKKYDKALKEARKRYQRKKEAFPNTTLAGEFASILIPGSAVAKVASKSGKGLRALAKALQGTEKTGKLGKVLRAGGKSGTAASVESLGRQEGEISVAELGTAFGLGGLFGSIGRGVGGRFALSPAEKAKARKQVQASAEKLLNADEKALDALEKAGIGTREELAQMAVSKDILRRGTTPEEYLQAFKDRLAVTGKKMDNFTRKIDKSDLGKFDSNDIADSITSGFKQARYRGVDNLDEATRLKAERLSAELEELQGKITRTSKPIRKRKLVAQAREKQFQRNLLNYPESDRRYIKLVDELNSRMKDKLGEEASLNDLVKVKNELFGEAKKMAQRSGIDTTKDTFYKDMAKELTEEIDNRIENKLGSKMAKEYKDLRREWRQHKVVLDGLGTSEYKGMKNAIADIIRDEYSNIKNDATKKALAGITETVVWKAAAIPGLVKSTLGTRKGLDDFLQTTATAREKAGRNVKGEILKEGVKRLEPAIRRSMLRRDTQKEEK